MGHSLVEIEAIVRKKICSVCSDRNMAGECGLEDPAACSLFRLFPRVAESILETRSDEIGDYIQAIRRNVCSACGEQAPDGSCESRRAVRCALDAYLLLVVDAIEEATGKSFDRAGLSHG